MSWKWLDGNQDGIAECYYFDSSGYMLAGTATPDGYQVNAEGAWVENGIITASFTCWDKYGRGANLGDMRILLQEGKHVYKDMNGGKARESLQFMLLPEKEKERVYFEWSADGETLADGYLE